MKRPKIGIYGGSFSPPHLGHERLATAFLDFANLDILYIIPAGTPPHKRIDKGADGDARLEMCREAFTTLSDKISVSDFEAYRTDPCYTVDTLNHFANEGELYMLCGSDMFLTLDTWRDPAGIFRLATVICGSRRDDTDVADALAKAAEKYRLNYSAKCAVMDFDPVEISSTDIRNELREGKTPCFISDGVMRVIKARGLYGYEPRTGDGDE